MLFDSNDNFESSLVVQELELAMKRALYGILWTLGNQYIVGSLSWSSLILTANLVAVWQQW